MEETALATPAGLRDEIDRAIARDDRPRARMLLRRLWSLHRGPSQAGFVSSRWSVAAEDRPSTSMRVVVLRSFTVEPVVPVVRAGGALGGLDLSIDVGAFNAYGQEILDPSSALLWGPDDAGEPDAVVLAVHTRDVAPDLWSGDIESSDDRRRARDRVVDEVGSLVRAFRERSSTPLVVHGLERPPRSGLGLADRSEELGQRQAISEINDRLVDVARSLPDVHVLDFDEIACRVGRFEVTDERKWASMRLPLGSAAVTALADEWLRYLHPIAGRVAKVAVVDLDNTIWGGVLGEEGADGVLVDEDGRGAPWARLQELLVALRRRGVLLAVCSKNDHEPAVAAIDSIPGMRLRSTDFHAFRINWRDKATNLREIADELNVGLDSLAFIDDNPAERLLVEGAVPEVHVVDLPDDPSGYVRAVDSCPLFERLALTDEDRRRSDMYAAERTRREVRASAADLESYLRSLGTQVRITQSNAEQIARVAQLTQKTNQFNVTTRRYSEDVVRTRLADPEWNVYSLVAQDRFGDHGLVGVAMVESALGTWSIDTLLLSCRVIGRDVESALLARIVDDARSAGAEQVLGRFVPTERNGPAADLFARHEFTRVDDGGEGESWAFDVENRDIRPPEWIEVSAARDSSVV